MGKDTPTLSLQKRERQGWGNPSEWVEGFTAPL